MLRATQQSGRVCGFKVSDGIGSADTAARYLDIAVDVMGEAWIQPDTFRFGASGVLADILSALEGRRFQGTVSVTDRSCNRRADFPRDIH